MAAAWHEESIRKSHNRSGFDCGEPELNDFLRQNARQNHEKGVSKTFVALGKGDDATIMGYYTLSPASIAYARVPDVIARTQGRYDVGGFRLARLAVAMECQSQGLGGQLLAAAARRCLRVAAEVGGTALLIDAKNERAAAWYRGYGAVSTLDAPLTLVMPLAALLPHMERAGAM
jgi:ribosomal protein S18 acetylase RimI-like enzyme